MNFKHVVRLLIVFISWSILFASSSIAASYVANITRFEGEVVVQSSLEFREITHVGMGLVNGDVVLTKNGEVTVEFNDGAILNIRPHTSVKIQEREEKRGFWPFKTKKWVRRLTALVGKARFRSGRSKTANYLQTPTAVCGIRGSEADWGYNNTSALIDILQGQGDFDGKFITGYFAEPTRRTADENDAYTALVTAGEASRTATGLVARARANKAAAEAIKTLAESVSNNASAEVRGQFALLEQAADALIQVADNQIRVAEMEEKIEAARKTDAGQITPALIVALDEAKEKLDDAIVSGTDALVAAEQNDPASVNTNVSETTTNLGALTTSITDTRLENQVDNLTTTTTGGTTTSTDTTTSSTTTSSTTSSTTTTTTTTTTSTTTTTIYGG